MKKLIILQTATPDYRKKFFSYLKEALNENFKFYTGKSYFEPSIKSDNTIKSAIKIRNHFLLKRSLLFQTGKIWNEVLKNNVMVLEMNPRIISNWFILFIRKLTRKKTILWGHAWPRNGANSKSDRLRNFMRVLSDEIIVYTKTQQQELQKKMPNKIISASPNAVFYKNEMVANQDSDIIKNIIYVGRLSKQKKPLFLVKSFHKVLKSIPKDSKLLIIGEGEEKTQIENYIKHNNLSERIRILGHIGNYSRLKDLYHSSIASVSPGYIGLSVTQSFGFGVPMIVSKTEPHSPEIEAVIESENAKYFVTDNVNSLANEIIEFYNKKMFWIDKRKSICVFCKENYSVDAMAENFIKKVV